MNISRFAFLALVVGVCLLACADHAHADVSAATGKITVAGTAVMHDGTPAAGAFVESPRTNVTETIRTRADGQGRFQLTDPFGYGCRIHVRSADDTEHATLQILASEVRTRLAKPVEFKLAPAKEQTVTVLSAAGQPVAGAHVLADGRAFRSTGITGADGTARLRLPEGEELQALVAWHPALGTAGRLDYQKGLKDETFQLALLPPAPHTIRFLDVEGKPVPDLEFGASIRIKPIQWIVTDHLEAARLRTDANGEVTVPWIPRELDYVDANIAGDDWKIDDTELDKIHDGPTTVHVRHKVPISGRLIMPEGASAEGIVISGFGFGPKSNGDVPATRAAADGTFTLSVAPDHGYALNIRDSEWASDGWSGLILADENATPAEISMDVYPATLLEVRVTRGAEHKGVADAWVFLQSEQRFTWRNAAGANRNAIGGRQDHVRTDAGGTGILAVGRGKQKLTLRLGNWNEEQAITVDSDEPRAVEFHRAWLTERKLAGRLLLDNSPHKPSASAKIEAATSTKGFERSPLACSLQPDGTFEVAGDASDISILVIDREQRLGGFASVGANDTSVDLELSPMAAYSGTLTDRGEQPHAGKKLRIVVKGTDHQAAEEQVSDAGGRFKFPLVVANVPLTGQVEQQTKNGTYFRQVGELLLKPGETRQDAARKIDLRDPDQQRFQSDPAIPFAQQLAGAVRNAHLGGMHVLAILMGDSSDKVTQLVEAASNALAYVPLVVDEKAIQSNTAQLKELGWQVPQAGEVVLVALDGDGKQLGTERLVAGQMSAAVKTTGELLKKHLPPVRDAQARFAAGQEIAKATGRRLWIVEGGPRCGPCFRLARWMDDQHALLDKDYVIVKVMGGLDLHAADVIKPLNRPQSGIPWFAITEASGEILATSESPLGNIGMPSTVEGIRYVREIFKRTAQRLTDDDIDQLAKSLAEFK